ncbi:hypothetical protein, partial [Mechercharimyces sp. CAU 1602]|uniref:hypothetical protein n=1 Tax=Mechercharimyces sp. CAU 1602 TaxID=2973933 RepID=UPI002161B7C8
AQISLTWVYLSLFSFQGTFSSFFLTALSRRQDLSYHSNLACVKKFFYRAYRLKMTCAFYLRRLL